MKLPLKFGLPILVGLWLLYGFLEDPNSRTVLLIVAMGVALWTAFSLNIPPRKEGDQDDSALRLEEEDEAGASRNEGDEEGGKNEKPGDRDRPR